MLLQTAWTHKFLATGGNAYARVHATHLEAPGKLKLLLGQVINVLLQCCELAALGWQRSIDQAVC